VDISGTSVALSQLRVKEQASLSVMKLAMNKGKQTNNFINDMMESNKTVSVSANPNIGRNIDVRG